MKPAAKTAKAKPKRATAGNADLVANLRANPADAAARGVYADWLQGEGNPLGEVIALELAGKADAATRLRRKHAAVITGGFAGRMFAWSGGFIDKIMLEEAKPAAQRAALDKALDLPAAVLVRAIVAPVKLDDAYVAFLNRRLPPTVTTLFTWLANPVGKLALPHVVTLSLYMHGKDGPDPAALGPLFEGSQLPEVRRLEFHGGVLEPAVVRALLESELLRRLEWLVVYKLDEAGIALVRERRAKLAHIKILRIANLDDELGPAYQAWMRRANEGL